MVPVWRKSRDRIVDVPWFPAYRNRVAAGFLANPSLGVEIGAFDLDAPPPIAEQVEVQRLQNHDLLPVEGQTVTTADHDRVVACFPPLQPANRVGAGPATPERRVESLFGPDLQQPQRRLLPRPRIRKVFRNGREVSEMGATGPYRLTGNDGLFH